MRSERKDVHHPEHSLAARVVVRQVDIEVECDALRSDEVVRLVPGRTRADLEVDEQVDRKREREGQQPGDEGPDREAVASRLGECASSRAYVLLDTRRHAEDPYRRRSPSTLRKSADSTVCMPHAINVAPGMTIRSVSG
jgi:hypothetical protein